MTFAVERCVLNVNAAHLAVLQQALLSSMIGPPHQVGRSCRLPETWDHMEAVLARNMGPGDGAVGQKLGITR